MLAGMEIDAALAEFIDGPVMIVAAVAGPGGMPEIARAAGATADRAAGRLNLLVSAWAWPEAAAAMVPGARIAVTLARPADYVSLQIKGVVDTTLPATADDAARAGRYVAGMTAALSDLGLDPFLIKPWFSDRDLLHLTLRPQAVFVQTPGPKAGQVLA